MLLRRLCWIILLLVPTSLWAQVASFEQQQLDYDGDVISSIERSYADSTLLSSSNYIYRKGGDLAVVITYYYNELGVVNGRMVSYYDTHKRLTSRTRYLADETVDMEEHYTYDRKGRLSRRVQRSFDNYEPTTVVEKRTYKGNTAQVKGYCNKVLTYQYSLTTKP